MSMKKEHAALWLSGATCCAGIFQASCLITDNLATFTGDAAGDCMVTRSECVATDAKGNCTTFQPAPTFRATVCLGTNDTFQAACTSKFCPTNDPYVSAQGCTAMATTSPQHDIAFDVGACNVDNAQDDKNQAFIQYTQRFIQCTPSADGTNPCEKVTLGQPAQVNTCIDLSSTGAVAQLTSMLSLPEGPIHDESVEITSIELNATDHNCPQAQGDPTTPNLASFAVTPGLLGVASGGGVSIPMQVTGGFVTLAETPVVTTDDFGPGTSTASTINALILTLADTQVSGIPIVGIHAQNVGPVALDASGQIPTGALTMFLQGQMNGRRVRLAVVNTGTWSTSLSSSGFSLSGPLTVTSTDLSGHLLTVSTNVSVSSTPSTPQQLACANESPLQALFGFENRSDWSSTAALSAVTSPVTQGCAALGINGQGYMTINGPSFSTKGLSVQPALSVDLFVPSGQPNPFWLGALQMYLTCPAGHVFNQYVGQAELTGLPQGAFSTLRVPMPAATVAALQGGSQCALSFALNVNATGKTWELDNLRFTP
jgi:hypothetical protein